MHQHLADVLSRLDASRAALGAAVDTVPAPLRQQRPDAERWSVAEVLEHLSIVARIFTGRVADALNTARAAGLAAESSERLPLPDAVETRMANRVNRRPAPEAAVPTGTLDAAAAWAAIESAHQRLHALAEEADGLALSQVMLTHPIFGTMSVYQFVELIAAHEGRHTEQIKEIARSLSLGGAAAQR
jgi:hypothetical protein